MSELQHAMGDLETMGTTPDCAIVSIGFVLFDPVLNKVSDDTFYTELDWKNQNRSIDTDTVKWWKGQSSDAKKGLKGRDGLYCALGDLDFWLPDNVIVWGNGSIFDIAILEDAYRRYKMDIPWKFYNIMDCRTIKYLFESMRGGLDKKISGTKHNALDDAKHQAKYICHMWNKITNRGF